MRKDFLIGIVATVLAMGLYYYFDHSEALPAPSDDGQTEETLEKIQEKSFSHLMTLKNQKLSF